MFSKRTEFWIYHSKRLWKLTPKKCSEKWKANWIVSRMAKFKPGNVRQPQQTKLGWTQLIFSFRWEYSVGRRQALQLPREPHSLNQLESSQLWFEKSVYIQYIGIWICMCIVYSFHTSEAGDIHLVMSIPLKRTIFFQCPLGILPPFFYLSSPLLQKGTVLRGYLLKVCTKEMRLVLLIYFLHNWAAIDFISHSPRLYFLPLFNNGKCGGGGVGEKEGETSQDLFSSASFHKQRCREMRSQIVQRNVWVT